MGIHDVMCKFDINVILKIKLSDEYKSYVLDHPEVENLSTLEVATRLGKNYLSLMTREARIFGDPFKRLSEKEIVLNKKQDIYPSLTMQGFMNSEQGKKYILDVANSLGIVLD